MKNKFMGYYFKHHAGDKTLALIPGRSVEESFIQLITDEESYFIPYKTSDFEKTEAGSTLRVGDSLFSVDGIDINISRKDISITGRIRYRGITPVKSDIMGPFRFFPMECRHTVVSMRHRLDGAVTLNGEKLDFTGGTGYIEGDAGRSFPSRYTWAQANVWDGGSRASVMASAALIPFAGRKFWGCIAEVSFGGREYRLATYRGAKITRREKNELEISQGQYSLRIMVPELRGNTLSAPLNGVMERSIHESAAVPARFIFKRGNDALFDMRSRCAGYEFVE